MRHFAIDPTTFTARQLSDSADYDSPEWVFNEDELHELLNNIIDVLSRDASS